MPYRGILGEVRPEVEKPSAKTTVWRPLLLAVLLVGVAVVAGGLVVVWMMNLGRLVGGALVGPLIALSVLLYGAQSVHIWPPSIAWNERARRHRVVLLAVLGAALLAGLLFVLGHWPQPRYNGIQLLWWVIQPMPPAEGGGIWGGVLRQPMREIMSGSAVIWLRVVVCAALPFAMAYAIRLVWYRFGVEIVYPSWSDGAVPRGLRWLDPLGLLDIRLPAPEDEEAMRPAESMRGDVL